MKYLLTVGLFIWCVSVFSQRPATKAEHDEDARVLKIISSAMPHGIEDVPSPEERSYKGIGGNTSDLSGVDGFHTSLNFVTRDVFNHYYKADYQFLKLPDELKDQLTSIIDEAKQKNDIDALQTIDKITNCTITISINQYDIGNGISSNFPISKFNSSYTNMAYSDSKGYNTILYFGNCKPIIKTEDEEGGNGELIKKYSVVDNSKLQIGTVIQTIALSINAHPVIANFMLKHINVQQIKNLLGTGKFSDDISESEFKKYFPERAVKPLPGKNSVSFIYVDENGNEKSFLLEKAPRPIPSGGGQHDCSILVNHNENPKILENAELIGQVADAAFANEFSFSLPIVRTTGTLTATYQTNNNYSITWGTHIKTATGQLTLFPDEINITITKWAPVGDFIEGTFSGTATSSDPKDPAGSSDTAIKYIIKNGKFKLRRIEDEMKIEGLQ